MNLNSSVKMGGRFSVGVIDPLTGEVSTKSPWVSNLVVNTAEDTIYNGFSSAKVFSVGTSDNPLQPAQTDCIEPALFDYIGESVTPDSTITFVNGTDGIPEIHVVGSSVFRVKMNEATTLKEIAIRNFCRAIIIDSDAGTIGFPVDVDVTLEITYEFTMVYRITRRNLLSLEGVGVTTDGIDHFTDSTLAVIATPAKLTNPAPFQWDTLLSSDLVFKVSGELSADENVFDETLALDATTVDNNVVSRMGKFVDPSDTVPIIRTFYFGNASFGVSYVLVETTTDNAVGLVVDSGDQIAFTTNFNWIH